MRSIRSILIAFPFVFPLWNGLLLGQESDTVTLKHVYYSATFNTVHRFSVVVKYWLTRTMLDCIHRVKRTNKFKPDPFLPEYTSLDKEYRWSGYDRGHHMDAYDCGCDSIGMIESFYYSNISPQTPSLNRGRWKSLEERARRLARKYDSVLVWCGSVTSSVKHIGAIAVPDYCWKIVYIKRLGRVEAYSFTNDDAPSQHLEFYKVSLDSVQKLSGFVFTKN